MICCGLIEAIPLGGRSRPVDAFSAVICCGLIEAERGRFRRLNDQELFSAVICCGLIEAAAPKSAPPGWPPVFRSDMLRPH